MISFFFKFLKLIFTICQCQKLLTLQHYRFRKYSAFFLFCDTDQFGRFAFKSWCTAEARRGCQRSPSLKMVRNRLVPWLSTDLQSFSAEVFHSLMWHTARATRYISTHFSFSPFKNHLVFFSEKRLKQSSNGWRPEIRTTDSFHLAPSKHFFNKC